MTKLWEISTRLQALAEKINDILDCDNLQQDDKEAYIATNFDQWQAEAGSFEDKLNAIAAVLRQKKAILKAQQDEIKRLQLRATSTQAQIAFLTRYALGHMEQTGIKKASDPYGSISLRRNPPSLKIDLPEEQIPDQFVTIQTLRKIDRQAVETAIKTGQIHWASLTSQGNHLILK